MRKTLLFIALALLFSSCKMFSFDNPEMRGKEEIKISKINGKTIEFTVSATVFNPNWYGLKVKPSMLDLYIDDEFVGKVHLDKKVKLKGKKENDLNAVFTATLEGNVLLKAMKYATKDKLKVQLKGEIKGGVFIFSKKFAFDETKTIPGSSFKMGGGSL